MASSSTRLLAADGHAARQDPCWRSCGQRARRLGRCGDERPAFWQRKRVFVDRSHRLQGGWLALWLERLGAEVTAIRSRRRPSRVCSSRRLGACSPATSSPTFAMPTRCRRRWRAARRSGVPSRCPAAGARVVPRPGRRPTRSTSWAPSTCSRLRSAAEACRRRQRDHRQVLREQGMGLGLPRGRADRRPRPLFEQQGLRGAGDRERIATSFLRERGVAVATARAGNVIGGGDWAADRLVPDFFRACRCRRAARSALSRRGHGRGSTCSSRSRAIFCSPSAAQRCARAAPRRGTSARSTTMPGRVCWLLERLVARGPGARGTARRRARPRGRLPEARQQPARARSSVAAAMGCWTGARRTVDWHAAWQAGGDMQELCCEARSTHTRCRRAPERDETLSVVPTPLAGLMRVDRARLGDERGFFTASSAPTRFAVRLRLPVAQINHTLTREARRDSRAAFPASAPRRGQAGTCLRGEVFDVAVDLRRGSPTFLQWHGESSAATTAAAC